MGDFKIVRYKLEHNLIASIASPEDLAHLHQLLRDTALWLQGKGSKQWQSLLNGSDVHDTEGSVNNKQAIIFHMDNKLAGMLILLSTPSDWDQRLWNDATPAWYVHRLTVDRTFSGLGIGKKIMKWLEYGLKSDSSEKTRIRLDCMADSSKLNEFYRDLGYQFMGMKDGFSLYEKIINQIPQDEP